VPNNITNNVVVLGKPEDIRLFVEMAFIQPGEAYPDDPTVTNDKDFPVLNFGLVIPEPANIERGGCNGQHDEGVVCWYEWNLANWGTKWGAYSHDGFDQRWLKGYGPDAEVFGRVDFRFDTAWNAPVPVFEAIEQRWGVHVHSVSQDEGGFPDTIFGDPYGEEVIRKIITFEFDSYQEEVPEPEVAK
jgi:hypothetical protein